MALLACGSLFAQSALTPEQLTLRVERLTELSQRIGISMTNLSLLKTGKVKAIRFSTLAAICRHLQCQPGDILEYVGDDEQSTEN